MGLPSWADADQSISNVQVAKSAGINILSGAFRFAASMGAAIVLGRLLTPDDFGLVGMVLPVIAFLLIVSDMGISNYVLQHKKCSEVILNSAFGLSVAIVLVTCLAMVFSSGYIADFYSEPRLTDIVLVSSLSIFLTIFTATHNALVKKYHRQDLFAFSEIVGSLCASVFPIVLALNGVGYWALVFIPICRYVGHSISIWALTKWVPNFTPVGEGHYSDIVRFSSILLVYQIFTVVGKNIDKVVVGYSFGTEELGYYNMAVNLMLLPALQVLAPVGGAIIPYFSRLSDRDDFFDCVVAAAQRLGIVVIPFMVTAAVFSKEIIVLVLGEKWVPTSEIFSILAFVSIVYVHESVLTWSVIASGKPKLLAKWVFLSTGMLSLSIFIGAEYGVHGVALGLLCSSLIVHVLYAFYVSRNLNGNSWIYIKHLFKIIIFCLILLFSQVYSSEVLDDLNFTNMLSVILGFGLCLISSVILVYFLFGVGQLKEIVHLVRAYTSKVSR